MSLSNFIVTHAYRNLAHKKKKKVLQMYAQLVVKCKSQTNSNIFL